MSAIRAEQMNAGRKANRQEAEKEFKQVHSQRQGAGRGSAGGDAGAAAARQQMGMEARLVRKGLNVDDAHLLESAASVQYKNSHKKSKGGVQGEWYEQSYDRDVRRLATAKAAAAEGGSSSSTSSTSSSSSRVGGRGADRDGGVRGKKRELDYGRRPKGQTAGGLDALAADIIGRETKRAKSKVSTDGGRDTQVPFTTTFTTTITTTIVITITITTTATTTNTHSHPMHPPHTHTLTTGD